VSALRRCTDAAAARRRPGPRSATRGLPPRDALRTAARLPLVRRLLRTVPRRLQRRRLIDGYLREHGVRKLHLGAAENVHPGWLNTDLHSYGHGGELVYLDVRKPFPLPDASFDFVFSEHMLEHLTYEEGQQCLGECLRVLRPGGTIRTA